MVAKRLYDLYEQDKDDDGEQHERKVQAFIAIGESEVTHAASTDGTCHGSRTQQADCAGRDG